MGTIPDRWIVYPLGEESENGTALQDYSRRVRFTPVLKTDNTKSEMKKWIYHFRQPCIEQTTAETHSTWENHAEPKIGKIGSMVRNFMTVFDVPLK